MSAAPAATFDSLRGRHVLVTGGTGYIGSHTVLQLLQAGARVTIVDNLINSSLVALRRVERILAQEPKHAQLGTAQATPVFHKVDLRDYAALEAVFKSSTFDACIHFAGLKAVGESVSKPLLYYEHNIVGTLNLLRLLDAYACRRVVFSSSATVYGLAEVNPVPETAPLRTTNPYGQTKLVIEEMLRDLAKAPLPAVAASSTSSGAALPAAGSGWKIVILRYFNPIGAHPSGLIGEDPAGIPNNLLPFIMQVCVGRRKELSIFGNDYPTVDGTGVRDYIHVLDLASGHLAALQEGIFAPKHAQEPGSSCDVFNLGTGSGVSVLQMVAAAEKASGKPVPYTVVARRTGDIATCYADASKAQEHLHWRATHTLEQAVADSWRWQHQNPRGFADEDAQQQQQQGNAEATPQPPLEREIEVLSHKH